MAQSFCTLVVDDDEVVRRIVVRGLRERGYTVHEAGTAQEALNLCQNEPIERMLLDFRLPDRSGLEVLRELHARGRVPEPMRVVVWSGYGSIPAATDAMRLGALEFLPKPVDVDEVLRAFERCEQDDAHWHEPPPETPSLARTEWEHINRVLFDSGYNISEAARRLHIHRRSLQRKLQKYPPAI